MKKFLPYIVTLAILYYAFPYIFLFIPFLIGIRVMVTFIATLFILMIISIMFGKHHRFSLLFLIFSVVLFLPYGLIVGYGILRTLVYAVCYLIVALIGSSLGLMFSKKEK